MFEVIYTAAFKRRIKKIPISVARDFYRKSQVLKDNPFHPSLKTHKLGGNLKAYWAFSVTYEYRVVFRFDGEKLIILMAIGTHDMYRKQID